MVPGERPRLLDVVAFGNPDLYAGLIDEDAPIRFAPPVEETALIGAGITHHIAWRAADDDEQAAWAERLSELGLRPTAQQERKYFRSIYFRMPDAILLEIATDGPGFLVDETADAARPDPGAAAVARAGARDARARARPDRLSWKRGSRSSPVVRNALERT